MRLSATKAVRIILATPFYAVACFSGYRLLTSPGYSPDIDIGGLMMLFWILLGIGCFGLATWIKGPKEKPIAASNG